MRRLALILAALTLAACAAREVMTGTSAQRAVPVPSEASRARAVARALCGVPPGCFAYPPECQIHTCFCPAVCVKSGHGWNSHSRIWRTDVAECACEPVN